MDNDLEGDRWWIKSFGQPKKRPITLAGSTLHEWAEDAEADAVLKECINQAINLLTLGAQHRLNARKDRARTEGSVITIIKRLCDLIGRKAPEFIRPQLSGFQRNTSGYCINCGERLPLDECGFCINCEDGEKKRQEMQVARTEREQREQYKEDLRVAAMQLSQDIRHLEARLRCKTSFKTPKI